MVLLHRGVRGAQRGASLVESGAGSELTEEFGHAMDAARDHRGGEMVRTDDDVADDFCIRGIRHTGFEDADHRGRTIAKAAEANGLADHTGIFFVNGGPKTIRENDDARSIGSVVLRSDHASRNSTQAHYFKIVAANHA